MFFRSVSFVTLKVVSPADQVPSPREKPNERSIFSEVLIQELLDRHAVRVSDTCPSRVARSCRMSAP